MLLDSDPAHIQADDLDLPEVGTERISLLLGIYKSHSQSFSDRSARGRIPEASQQGAQWPIGDASHAKGVNRRSL